MKYSPRQAAGKRRSVRSLVVRLGPVWLAVVWPLIGAGCNNQKKADDRPLPPAAPSVASAAAPAQPTLPTELEPKEPEKPAEPEEDEPLVVGPPQPPKWDGPYLVVTRSSGGVYSEPKFDRKKKIGYLRNGAKIAVKKAVVSEEECKNGWHDVVGGGFVCANLGTMNPKDKKLKFVHKQPVLDEVLPYTYARNAKNGTPLYKSVPTPEQMYGYEPYLEAAKEWREKQAAEKAKAEVERADDKPSRSEEAAPVKPASASANDELEDETRKTPTEPNGTADAPARADDAEQPTADGAEPEEPATPWWQQDADNASLHEVTLNDLQKEADDVLAMRMMKGFYVAVDRTFRWNDRLWYKTTKDLVAPADRFWQVAGSKFQGVELDGDKHQLPMGFVYGSIKKASLYALDSDDKLKPEGSVERMDTVNLTGKEKKIGKNNYLETTEGLWIKEYQVRVARAVEPQEDIQPRERWLDINVTTQTLVAYVGSKPVYATMVSSGKKSTVKTKDHRTPRGAWRIREKHVATTMDGDGTAAGDLPYSIEDVPYVAYFHRSYAVHGAFWHRNYGVRMSHGCVNLSPLDAKWVFFFTDPQLPAGWHGVWSTDKNPGSRVVVHE